MITVLIFALALPLFDSSLLFDEAVGYQEDGLEYLRHLVQDFNASDAVFEDALGQYVTDSGRLVYLEVCSPDSVDPSRNAGCNRTIDQSTLYGYLEELRFQVR